MIPGMNPRQAKKMMQKMGIQQHDIEAEEVIIRTADHDLVFGNPQVAQVNMMGQETYQIVGTPERVERDTAVSIDEEDIKTVAEQANVSEEDAKKALEAANGDLAQAIIDLQHE